MSRDADLALKIRTRIRELREKQGLTQEQLSARSGIYYKHVQALESKKPMVARIDTLEKICKGFDLKLHEFFNDPVFTHAERITIPHKTKTTRK